MVAVQAFTNKPKNAWGEMRWVQSLLVGEDMVIDGLYGANPERNSDISLNLQNVIKNQYNGMKWDFALGLHWAQGFHKKLGMVYKIYPFIIRGKLVLM